MECGTQQTHSRTHSNYKDLIKSRGSSCKMLHHIVDVDNEVRNGRKANAFATHTHHRQCGHTEEWPTTTIRSNLQQQYPWEAEDAVFIYPSFCSFSRLYHAVDICARSGLWPKTMMRNEDKHSAHFSTICSMPAPYVIGFVERLLLFFVTHFRNHCRVIECMAHSTTESNSRSSKMCLHSSAKVRNWQSTLPFSQTIR